jgi:hypothetical protein
LKQSQLLLAAAQHTGSLHHATPQYRTMDVSDAGCCCCCYTLKRYTFTKPHIAAPCCYAVSCCAGMVKPLAPGSFAPPPGFPEGPAGMGGRMGGEHAPAAGSAHHTICWHDKDLAADQWSYAACVLRCASLDHLSWLSLLWLYIVGRQLCL